MQIVSQVFWNHSEQHSSKTPTIPAKLLVLFWNHSEQHSSKTHNVTKQQVGLILEPFRTTQL